METNAFGMLMSEIEHSTLSDGPGSALDPVREHELRSLFTAYLPSHTAEEFARVRAVREALDREVTTLQQSLEDGQLSEEEFVAAANSASADAAGRCAEILGHDRFSALFGLDDPQQAAIVGATCPEDAAPVGQPREPAEVRDMFEPLLARYKPVRSEQVWVARAIGSIDPQQPALSIRRSFGKSERYRALVRALASADAAYHRNDPKRSIEFASEVSRYVERLSTISDEPLYFVSWAFHLQGRAYEVQENVHRAGVFYRASLRLKLFLEKWLPELFTLATEVKLANVEMSSSPIEGVVRLDRVEKSLASRRRSFISQNERLYKNLLVDARISLARGLILLGDVDRAFAVANSASKIAVQLDDVVGSLRCHVLMHFASPRTAQHDLSRMISGLTNDSRSRLFADPIIARGLATFPDVVREASRLAAASTADSSTRPAVRKPRKR